MVASNALTKKTCWCGLQRGHAKQSLWVLVQKYNALCKDLREQTKWAVLFHCKDHFSFTHVLDENDVVPFELRFSVRTRLAEGKHSKLVLKTDQSTHSMRNLLSKCVSYFF